MRVKKYVDIRQEIEFELSVEDIAANIAGENDTDKKSGVLNVFNNFAGFMKAVPDKLIGNLDTKTRDALATFLFTQAKRISLL